MSFDLTGVGYNCWWVVMMWLLRWTAATVAAVAAALGCCAGLLGLVLRCSLWWPRLCPSQGLWWPRLCPSQGFAHLLYLAKFLVSRFFSTNVPLLEEFHPDGFRGAIVCHEDIQA